MNLFSGLKGEGLRQECCDHDMEFVDDSFSHEYGTKQIFYWRCKLCEKIEEVTEDYIEDYGPYDCLE